MRIPTTPCSWLVPGGIHPLPQAAVTFMLRAHGFVYPPLTVPGTIFSMDCGGRGLLSMYLRLGNSFYLCCPQRLRSVPSLPSTAMEPPRDARANLEASPLGSTPGGGPGDNDAASPGTFPGTEAAQTKAPSIDEVIKNYPNRNVYDARMRNQGNTGMARLNMWFSKESEIPETLKGTELRLPEAALPFFISAPDLTHLYRCPGSSSLSAPTCTGESCIPCYCAQLRRLHGNAGVEWFQEVVSLWQGIAGQHLDPVSGAFLPMHPRYLGTLDLRGLERVTPDVARGFVVKMVSLLLTQNIKTKNSLASIGGVRLYKQEVFAMALRNGMLSELTVAQPYFVSNRLIVACPKGEDTPVAAQGLQVTQDWGNAFYTAWILGVAGDAITAAGLLNVEKSAD